MALDLAKLRVLLELDRAQYDKGLADAQSGFNNVGNKMQSMGVKFSAAVGLPMAALAKASISAASDLNESISKVGVVFGDNAADIEAWARDSARALGISKQQALEAAGTFGNLFTSMGLGRPEAAKLSMDIVQLSSDLGSFNNIDPAIMLEKLRSGLVGEVEPLRAVGINLNAAAVEAKAMEMGLVGANGEVTEAGKVQARFALILEQSKNAQGDFARTADGVANKQRIAAAEAKNAAAQFGQNLLPIMGMLLKTGTDVLKMFTALPPQVQAAAAGAAVFAIALGPLLAIGGNVVKVVGAMVGLFQRMKEADDAAKASIGLHNALGHVNSTSEVSTTRLQNFTLAVGAVTAVLAIAVVGLQAYARDKAHAKLETDEFIEALKREKEGVEEATDAHILKKLEETGALKTLQAHGIATDLVTRAIKGETGARDNLRRQLEAEGIVTLDIVTAVGGLTVSHDKATEAVAREEKARNELLGAQQREADMISRMGPVTKTQTELVEEHREALLGAAKAADEQRKKLDDLWNAHLRQTNSLFAVVDAQVKTQESTVRLTQAREKYAEHVRNGTAATKEGEQAERDRVSAETDAIKSTQSYQAALLNLDGEMKNGKLTRDEVIGQLHSWATASGLTTDETQALVTKSLEFIDTAGHLRNKVDEVTGGPGVGVVGLWENLGTTATKAGEARREIGELADLMANVGGSVAGFAAAIGGTGDGLGVLQSNVGRVRSGASVGGSWPSITTWLAGMGQDFDITSTYRPGAHTAFGFLSYHALGKAVDMVGDKPAIYRRLEPLAKMGRLSELFYDPLGGWKNGQFVGAIGGHSDHVHAAVYHAGIDRVPVDTLAFLERGERVISARDNAAGVGGRPAVVHAPVTVIVNAPHADARAVAYAVATELIQREHRHLAAAARTVGT